MTKTVTTPERVAHILFGTGSVVEARITESGQSVSLIRFDSSTVDRLILTSSLKPSSSAPGDSGEAPKKGTKEPISDQLLVPELDDTLANAGEPETDETQALEAR